MRTLRGLIVSDEALCDGGHEESCEGARGCRIKRFWRLVILMRWREKKEKKKKQQERIQGERH